MKKVTEYQIVDHGFESPDYFQGCGTAYTEFDDVATGCGDTAKAAFDDALENLAQSDWDVSRIKNNIRSRMTVRGYLRRLGGLTKQDIEDSEMWYYVSVRVR
jgi:hypothetical protein